MKRSAQSAGSHGTGRRLPRFMIYLVLSAVLAATLLAVIAVESIAEQKVSRANEQRYQSYLLADELRQSGDDLTLMVRLYAVTADPVYKQRFQDILDVREGRKARPRHPHRPYWDLAPRESLLPRPDGQAIPLLELMRQAGFTREEFDKLALAKAYSDDLTLTELESMVLVESSGPQAAANRASAISMLFDEKYMSAKSDVMAPIDEFMRLLDERTQRHVEEVESRTRALSALVVAIWLALAFTFWRSYAALRYTLGGTLEQVYMQIARIGSGDLSSVEYLSPVRKSSVLGWLASLRVTLADAELERGRGAAKLRESEAFNRSIIESNPDCIKVLDLEANLLSISPSGQRLLGMKDLARYLGRNWVDQWQPADQPAVRAALAIARGGAKVGSGQLRPLKPAIRCGGTSSSHPSAPRTERYCGCWRCRGKFPNSCGLPKSCASASNNWN